MKEVKIKIVADTGQAKKGIDGLTDSTEELGNDI